MAKKPKSCDTLSGLAKARCVAGGLGKVAQLKVLMFRYDHDTGCDSGADLLRRAKIIARGLPASSISRSVLADLKDSLRHQKRVCGPGGKEII